MGQPVKAHEACLPSFTLSASQSPKSRAAARHPRRRRRYTAAWARYTAWELQ
jgi:hypothetical protein